jgi:transposase
MMNRYYLTDDQWLFIHEFLRVHPRVYVGQPDHCRQFINSVLWMLRSGSQWRSLPPDYGHWNTVFKRYDRWVSVGVWDDLLTAVSTDADLQEGFIDSTIVRAHACAAGAKKVMPKQKHSGDQKVDLAVKSMR